MTVVVTPEVPPPLSSLSRRRDIQILSRIHCPGELLLGGAQGRACTIMAVQTRRSPEP